MRIISQLCQFFCLQKPKKARIGLASFLKKRRPERKCQHARSAHIQIVWAFQLRGWLRWNATEVKSPGEFASPNEWRDTEAFRGFERAYLLLDCPRYPDKQGGIYATRNWYACPKVPVDEPRLKPLLSLKERCTLIRANICTDLLGFFWQTRELRLIEQSGKENLLHNSWGK